jgi:hypothetical protein
MAGPEPIRIRGLSAARYAAPNPGWAALLVDAVDGERLVGSVLPIRSPKDLR